MRGYLFVILLILVLMGGYVALLPLASSSDANTGLAGAGPFWGVRHDQKIRGSAACRTIERESRSLWPCEKIEGESALGAAAIRTNQNLEEGIMYAAIRQGKAKPGMAEELARTIKEGAIPVISDVPGFQAYYVIYAPDDTITAISIFDDYAGAAESNRRGLAWIEKSLAPLLTGPATAVAGPVIVHTLA
jgi:hypothetical protein